MDRRTLLAGLTALVASQVACQQKEARTLQVAVLKGTLPSQIVTAFEEAIQPSIKVNSTSQTSETELFQQLQQWQSIDSSRTSQQSFNLFGRFRSPAIADWVALSDYWLVAAIQQQLISPLEVDTISTWSELPDRWQPLLRRGEQGFLSATGPVWATPYRWGSLVMVYSRREFERLGWQPSRWRDLWNSDLAGRISLPNHPRLALGLALKSLEYSANDPNPTSHPDLIDALNKLPRQVKAFASDDYMQPLIKGDTWLAVGWSMDVRPIVSQYRQLGAVVPDPGTLLSADFWVKPKNPTASEKPVTLTDVDSKWLEQWWQPDILTPLSLFSQGLSPLLISPDAAAETAELLPDELLLPSASQREQSEFIEPLPQESIDRYTKLWRDLRGGE